MDLVRPTSAGEVLELLRTGQARTRTEVAQLTGLSRTAVLARVSALVDAGLVLPGDELTSTGGRPAASLVFNQVAGVVLAVAVGRSRSQLGVFDLDGRELASDSRDHAVGIVAADLMPTLVARLAVLLDDVTPPVLAVGMSISGLVDPVRMVSVDSPVMRGWDGVELAPYLAEITRAPLFLVNDAQALARSELFGRPDPPREALVVKASTGLGLGIISDGRVLTGAAGASGEIGHSKHPRADELPCRCGATGCLEAIAGGWALLATYADGGGEAAHIRELAAHAVEGDTLARRLLRQAGRDLGEVLAVAINLLNPQTVVIGGDMAQAFDTYAAGVREAIYADGTARSVRDLELRPSRHGERAGLVGCAAVAIEGVLTPASVDARLR